MDVDAKILQKTLLNQISDLFQNSQKLEIARCL